jgi:hypothetical protein
MDISNQNLDFLSLCEELYNDWKNDKFKEDLTLNKLFQMNYSPEPYFVLKNGKNPLYILLTNPGSGMDFQHISQHKNIDFNSFTSILSTVYTSETFKKQKGSGPAYRRLMKSTDFANHLGFDGVVNIETIPFHSEKLSKPKALKSIRESYTLTTYQNALKFFLSEKPVLIVAACSANDTISNKTIMNSEWLKYQCDLASIPINKLILKPFTTKNNKITSALFSHQNKYLVLMMGSNNLPSIK